MTSKRRHAPKRSAHHEAPAPQDDQIEEVYEDMQEQEPSPAPKPIARQATYDADRIGDILRRVREHRGEDLEYISEYLRIRPNYLFALENSRYEDLPADAYVIGFLRTYASYLGLDGKGAIDQYRREMTGRRRKPQLSMPQPMSEGRAPTIAMMIAAAIAALIIYGVWYGLSSPEHEELEKTTTLPDKVQIEPAKDTASLPAQTATTDGIALSVPETAVPATTTEPATPTTPLTTTAPAAVTPPPVEAAKPTPAPEPEKPATKDQKETKPAQTDKKAEALQTAAPTVTTTAQTTTEAAAPSKPETPTTYGEKTKSRVTIKADKESWVLITDSKGNTVFDRTLKPGESYNVPAGKGLKLTTGNANGISFTTDGKEVPKTQSSSPIIRALPLDVDKLKSGLNGEDKQPSPTTENTDADQ